MVPNITITAKLARINVRFLAVRMASFVIMKIAHKSTAILVVQQIIPIGAPPHKPIAQR